MQHTSKLFLLTWSFVCFLYIHFYDVDKYICIYMQQITNLHISENLIRALFNNTFFGGRVSGQNHELRKEIKNEEKKCGFEMAMKKKESK